jgi:hypothetical protein
MQLQGLIQGLNKQSGSENVIQSHRKKIKLRSLNNCLRMVRQNDACDINSNTNRGQYIPERIPSFYNKGTAKLSNDFDTGHLNQLRPAPLSTWDVDEDTLLNKDEGSSSETDNSDDSERETTENDETDKSEESQIQSS